MNLCGIIKNRFCSKRKATVLGLSSEKTLIKTSSWVVFKVFFVDFFKTVENRLRQMYILERGIT